MTFKSETQNKLIFAKMAEVRVLQTSRGGVKLVYNDYQYTKHKNNSNGTATWRCCTRPCPAIFMSSWRNAVYERLSHAKAGGTACRICMLLDNLMVCRNSLTQLRVPQVDAVVNQPAVNNAAAIDVLAIIPWAQIDTILALNAPVWRPRV